MFRNKLKHIFFKLQKNSFEIISKLSIFMEKKWIAFKARICKIHAYVIFKGVFDLLVINGV